MRAQRLAPLAALVAAAVALGACTRKPQLVPAGPDSTRAARPDSFEALARQAGDAWSQGDDEQAAAVSSRVVLEALRLGPAASWPERTRAVLDSLAIGAEVSGSDDAIVVNVFSRAEAEGPSWPTLYWRDASGPRMQAIEGRGMRLHDVATRGFGPDGAPGDSAQVAALWSRRAGAGQQPILIVWRHARGGRWDLAQTLGADSLGGTGGGAFASPDSGSALVTRTYHATPWFDECPTCPHVYHERRFEWGRDGFARVSERPSPSPYAAFTAFIAALVTGDRDAATRLTADPSLVDFALRYDWNLPARGRWRVAPSTEQDATEIVFFRGTNDAFRVTFEPRGADWVVRGFEAVPRTIE